MLGAIISDTHLGNPQSRLAPNFQFNPKGVYEKLKAEIKMKSNNEPVDYLILNGDIMDFSINSFHKSISVGRPFFQQLKSDNIANQIIYIPGNHDKQIWDAIQWDTNVIGNLSEFRDPTPFKCIQSGMIDFSQIKDLFLPSVTKTPNKKYGNFFLKGMFHDSNNTIPISVVYPNLYIKRTNDTILITHGNMTEQAWVLLSELLVGVATVPKTIGLKELEEWNVPLTSMICTGIGQAGAVSKLLYQIALEAYLHRTDTLKEVLNKIIPRIDKLIKLPWIFELIDNLCLKALKNRALSVASKVKETRSNEDLFKDDGATERFLTFFEASVIDMAKEEFKLKRPSILLYGHTHSPTPAIRPFQVKHPKIKDLQFYNTGGWLPDCEAELFFISDDKIESINI